MKPFNNERIAGVLALMLSSAAMLGCASAQTGGAGGHRTLLKAIVLGMGSEGSSVIDARYDPYFRQGTAKAGVPAVIAAGKFLVNGDAIPATEAEFAAKHPEGYQVNRVRWLYHDRDKAAWAGGYKGGKSAASYQAAALAVATGIVAGLEVRLYDTDRDGYADLIEADYKEGVTVERIARHGDGTYSVHRGDIGTANRTASEGRVFDGPHFTATSGERIKPENFDTAIAAGDVALFWYGPNGWVMQRAREVNGIFVDGSDHRSYTIDGTAYGDAMRFSRDNLPISNRPGEYANAQKYFGLNDNHEGLNASLWLVPTSDPHAQGAPVGITSNASARDFLDKALVIARQRLASVAVSSDGKDVPAGRKWVTQATYAQLHDAIARGHAALADAASLPALLDYQVYLLYLTLNGSQDDIGARFGGFDYPGFDSEIRARP